MLYSLMEQSLEVAHLMSQVLMSKGTIKILLVWCMLAGLMSLVNRKTR